LGVFRLVKATCIEIFASSLEKWDLIGGLEEAEEFQVLVCWDGSWGFVSKLLGFHA